MNHRSNRFNHPRHNQNMPYGDEGFGNAYPHRNFEQDNNDVYSGYNSPRFRNRQRYNWDDEMEMRKAGRNVDRDWNDLVNWADEVTNNHSDYPRNYGDNYRHGMFDRSNYGERHHRQSWNGHLPPDPSLQEMHTRDRRYIDQDYHRDPRYDNFGDEHMRSGYSRNSAFTPDYDNFYDRRNYARTYNQPHHARINPELHHRLNNRRNGPGFYNNDRHGW